MMPPARHRSAATRPVRSASPWLAVCGSLVLCACGDSSETSWRCTVTAGVETCDLSLVEAEPAEPFRCRDVAGGRLCFAPAGAGGRVPSRYRCRLARMRRICTDEHPPLPDGSPSDWRCDTVRTTRSCTVRLAGHGQWFTADAGPATRAWSQRRYTLPDEAEWECAEIQGIAYCRTTGEAAAVDRRTPASFWICGDLPEGRRVCVDPDPDRPSDTRTPLACHFDHDVPHQRICGQSAQDDGACERDDDCGDGAVCAGRRCAPLVASAECYFDRDCAGSARCRWGACVGTETSE